MRTGRATQLPRQLQLALYRQGCLQPRCAGAGLAASRQPIRTLWVALKAKVPALTGDATLIVAAAAVDAALAAI